MAAPVKNAVLDTSSQGTGGGSLTQRQLWKVFDAEVVNATAAVESNIDASTNGFSLADGSFFGIYAVATSGGTIAVDIKIQLSYNDTAANYVAPSVNATVGSLSNTTAQVFPVNPPPMPRMRIQLQGTGSNAATTAITLYLWIVK
jgi:hypothetical protein